MHANKVREDFELAAKNQGLSLARTHMALRFANGTSRAAGDYHALETLCAWWAWQASREALVVCLPGRPYASEADQEQMTDYEIGIGHGGCEQWDKIREAIEAQGLKVK